MEITQGINDSHSCISLIIIIELAIITPHYLYNYLRLRPGNHNKIVKTFLFLNGRGILLKILCCTPKKGQE